MYAILMGSLTHGFEIVVKDDGGLWDDEDFCRTDDEKKTVMDHACDRLREEFTEPFIVEQVKVRTVREVCE